MLAEVSTKLGAPMVGISDIKGDEVNFRDREGGAAENHEARIPKKMQLVSGREPTRSPVCGVHLQRSTS